jgi:hypothetical protein
MILVLLAGSVFFIVQGKATSNTIEELSVEVKSSSEGRSLFTTKTRITHNNLTVAIENSEKTILSTGLEFKDGIDYQADVDCTSDPEARFDFELGIAISSDGGNLGLY